MGEKLERRFLTFEVAGRAAVLVHFLFQTPHDSKRVSTFAGADESAPFQRLDGIAIGREGVFLHYLSTAAELGCHRANQFQAGIHVGCAKAGLVSLCEFWQEISSFLLCHFLARTR